MFDGWQADGVVPPPRWRAVRGADEEACDLRFRALLGAAAWSRLPRAVRERFSRRLEDGEARLFAGEVVVTELSRAGRLLALAARLIGGPLPDMNGATGPATVSVREDRAAGGQVWTRTYTRRGRSPQTINSVKRFRGPTGLEESLGYGLTMSLRAEVADGALRFVSTGYGLEILGWRLPVPDWLSPGRCTIVHRAHGDRWFSFTLELTHPRFGRLVRQVAIFEEVGP